MASPPIAEQDPCPCFFGNTFVSVDESDATSADFQAPKKENRWCLMEMPKEQIEALEAGQLFHIKAHGSGKAALCTATQTFKLEFLENSNPMYLGNVAEVAPTGAVAVEEENKDPNSLPEGTAAKAGAPTKRCTIFAQCRGHVIWKSLSSDVQRVRDLLAPRSVDGKSEEAAQGASSSTKPEAMTTSDLQFQVAASPKELRTILEQGPYVERDGVWRWMPAAFEREVTDVSLNICSLHSWDRASVDVETLLVEVQKNFGEDGSRYVPSRDVLINALRGITRDAASPAAEKPAGEAAEAATDTAAEGKLALDAEKIKLFQATQLLREPPARLRERFDLPALASRPKRAKTAATAGAAAGGGQDKTLQIEEFCAAFTALTGTETTIEDISKIVGDRMYIDELDGAVHPLDVTTLPQDARERLKRLFELSSHWKPDRMSSLMAPVVRGAKIDVWLLKYTRTVFIEAEKGKEVRMLAKKFVGLS